ncbi:MAG: 30S ribosomal protein S1 [Candidatus Ratteibacteria bacterium]|nr:30S ribosomal protein S1 [Candidatus Ratteibacteria bacterium]
MTETKKKTQSSATASTAGKIEEMYFSNLKPITVGEVVKGKIAQISKGEALIDIGYKSEGVISLSNFDSPEDLKVGDELEVLIESKENEDGMVELSLEKADFIKNWGRIQKAYNSGEIIKGKITKKIKGGFIVNIGIPGFLPSSQVDIEPLKNQDDLVGKEKEFKILKTNQWRKNVVVSHKAYLEETRDQSRKHLLETLKPKDIVKGKVKNITDFGAFIDLGGLDGLLHITDISWGRISHPSEVLAIGEEVELVILEIDKEKKRVSLGLKQKTADPWELVEKKFPLNSKVKGTVVNITNYGIFLELEKGIEGLIHISELSWTKHISHPSQMLSIGDVVEAIVINIDKANNKIALSIKRTEADPWLKLKDKYPKGSQIKTKVRTITDYGVFVELEEGIEGLIHVSDLSWASRVEHPSKLVKKGEKIEVVVLDVDPAQRKISLGRKQLLPNPWEEIDKKYKIGMETDGIVTKVADFGAFVELEEGIEGLLHISDLSANIRQAGIKEETSDLTAQENEKKSTLKVGDKIRVIVVRVSPEERKIGLSLAGINDKSSTEQKKSKKKAT